MNVSTSVPPSCVYCLSPRSPALIKGAAFFIQHPRQPDATFRPLGLGLRKILGGIFQKLSCFSQTQLNPVGIFPPGTQPRHVSMNMPPDLLEVKPSAVAQQIHLHFTSVASWPKTKANNHRAANVCNLIMRRPVFLFRPPNLHSSGSTSISSPLFL